MCLTRPVVATALVKMLHMLYEVDILSEEAILSWHGNVNSPDYIPERKSTYPCWLINAFCPQDVCLTRPVVATALVKMLHMLYEKDILSEEAILN